MIANPAIAEDGVNDQIGHIGLEMIGDKAGMPTGSSRQGADSLATKVEAMFMEIMITAMQDVPECMEGFSGRIARTESYMEMLRQEFSKVLGDQVNDSKGLAAAAAASQSYPARGLLMSRAEPRRECVADEIQPHSRFDIAGPVGSSVRAVADGHVTESGVKGDYGNAIVVVTDDGRTMLYAHNHQNLVQVGDRVSRGDAIAMVVPAAKSDGQQIIFETKD
jgi:hypothetical protein